MSDLTTIEFLDQSFKKYSKDPDSMDWKHLCLDLGQLTCDDDSRLTDDALDGFGYMNQVIFNTVCLKCYDKKAFAWLKAYADAWTAGKELPLFPMECFVGRCDGSS